VSTVPAAAVAGGLCRGQGLTLSDTPLGVTFYFFSTVHGTQLVNRNILSLRSCARLGEVRQPLGDGVGTPCRGLVPHNAAVPTSKND